MFSSFHFQSEFRPQSITVQVSTMSSDQTVPNQGQCRRNTRTSSIVSILSMSQLGHKSVKFTTKEWMINKSMTVPLKDLKEDWPSDLKKERDYRLVTSYRNGHGHDWTEEKFPDNYYMPINFIRSMWRCDEEANTVESSDKVHWISCYTWNGEIHNHEHDYPVYSDQVKNLRDSNLVDSYNKFLNDNTSNGQEWNHKHRDMVRLFGERPGMADVFRQRAIDNYIVSFPSEKESSTTREHRYPIGYDATIWRWWRQRQEEEARQEMREELGN